MLKQGNIFFVSDDKGNVNPQNIEGLFYRDTRFISGYGVFWDGKQIFGTVSEKGNIENVLYIIDEQIRLEVERWLYGNCLYERITVRNFKSSDRIARLTISYDTDFRDIFIVRKFASGETGKIIGRSRVENELAVTYLGKDEIIRRLHLKCGGRLDKENEIEYKLDLCNAGMFIFEQLWGVAQGTEEIVEADFDCSYKRSLNKRIQAGRVSFPDSRDLIRQSLADIDRLTTSINGKRFIAAGVPCYATLFGRDAIITGIQLLGIKPHILKETLELLACFQGTRVDNYLEEAPGKILHEYRQGELANTHQIPFYPHYGSIDSTPLFLIGCAEYYRCTGDRKFVEDIMPAARKALVWINEYGDRDNDGYVEYLQTSEKGFKNHGWKDSGDSVVHKDGKLAKGAIALSEVQGYVYKAKVMWSGIFKEMGDESLARKLKYEADMLKRNFNRDFFTGDYFALGLDGNKDKIETVTSNPLHCLYCGIIDDDKVPSVVKRAFKEDMFSEYGIRTMSRLEKAYNPLSYHNGSIWPHDNSMIALGLKRYGYNKELAAITESIFKAGYRMKRLQMPELYGGENLEQYTDACVPQGWAAGAVVLLNYLGIMRPIAENNCRFSSHV